MQTGNQTQRRNVLDRLMRRAVLADANRVVRENVEHANFHERGHANSVPRVIAEHEEGADVRNHAPVQRHAVGNRAHAEFAHAVADVVAGAIGFHRGRLLVIGQIGASQIGRTADHFR